MNIIGYFHGVDPAAGLVQDGGLTAYVEEERLVRVKHAAGRFPIHAIDFCLSKAGVAVQDVDFFAYGWNAPGYTNGEMDAFFVRTNRRYPPDVATRAWQAEVCAHFAVENLKRRLDLELLRHFGVKNAVDLRFFPHHKSHAATAFLYSPFDEALVLTVDGSGDHQCATVWHGQGAQLRFLHEIPIPHSLGWLYAAMTEYLGFSAYDGEYKVMGLAAYGRENEEFRAALAQIVQPGEAGFDYAVNPKYIHHGRHTYSGRFTDHLVDLLRVPPRLGHQPVEAVHEDLAFATQQALEAHVLRLLQHFQQQTGLRTLCLAGGVALNVKMNSRIRASGMFDHVFIFPFPSDSSSGVGAAVGLWSELTGRRPPPLQHAYLGPAYTDQEIEALLRSTGQQFSRPDCLAETVAELLCAGKVVGWFQGALEAGPRALGARSILGDPRNVATRDRVNAAIKFREYWRPFCPSLTVETVGRFVQQPAVAPFMVLAFQATDEAVARVPGVVHVDQTMRIQTVDDQWNPPYHALLKAFEHKTGIPVLLNTSFNVRNEPIVCSPRDALRTFWSTGLDALAIGPFILVKPEAVARPADGREGL